ncbi:MAG: hypothetical protein ABIQ88_04215 [Chitinophagaceae bacterium]
MEDQIGLIAQEVEAHFPQLVLIDKEGIKSVAYANMVPVLVESIKEQQKMIEELQIQNSNQQKENELLKKDLALIKRQTWSIKIVFT